MKITMLSKAEKKKYNRSLWLLTVALLLEAAAMILLIHRYVDFAYRDYLLLIVNCGNIFIASYLGKLAKYDAFRAACPACQSEIVFRQTPKGKVRCKSCGKKLLHEMGSDTLNEIEEA